MFQQTLDGKARAWFEKLPPGSIENWGSLHEKFLNRFGMLKACDKDPTEISKIVRKASETLPHFKERCVSESNAIPNVPELMQISSFIERPINLKIALESGKLNHLIKDVRQRGKGRQQKAKVINMVQCHSFDWKRKTIMTDEGWMNVPIIFPPIPARDLSEEALVVEAEWRISCENKGQSRLGKIELDVCFGGSGRCRRAIMKFTVIPAPSPYNIILCHPRLKQALGAVLPQYKDDEIPNSLRSGNGGILDASGYSKEADKDAIVSLQIIQHPLSTPKDYYPLPKIDSKIEAVMGFPLKCFLDAYKGYHQVQMAEEDKEKIAFYTDQVAEEKFLGYMVTSEGIRANPAKTKDIAEMQSPRTWGNAEPSRKVSGTKPLPLPNRKSRKRFLRAQEDGLGPTGLNNPSAKRNPICIPSGIKRSSERSTASGKARKVTPCALSDTSGKDHTYTVELAAYNITYEPRSAIKGQILANFINEVPVGSEAMVPQETQYTIDHEKDCKEEWVLYTDGASSAKGSGIGLILINPTMTEYTYALRLNFESTNNQAEYEALLAGLRCKKMGEQSLSVNVDSKLVASQINGNYKACKENMI
ncbi:reverse transcriptase domain-containing protein [Tanacetum coccineum]